MQRSLRLPLDGAACTRPMAWRVSHCDVSSPIGETRPRQRYDKHRSALLSARDEAVNRGRERHAVETYPKGLSTIRFPRRRTAAENLGYEQQTNAIAHRGSKSMQMRDCALLPTRLTAKASADQRGGLPIGHRLGGFGNDAQCNRVR